MIKRCLANYWLNSVRTHFAFIKAVHELSHKRNEKKKWFDFLVLVYPQHILQCKISVFASSTKLHFAWKWSIEKKNRNTSIFCTQRKYLEFPVRKCSIYQLEDKAENEGCGRFCYHTHFLTKILFKYHIGLTLAPYLDDGFLWNAN